MAHEDLTGLELYEADAKLNARWESLKRAAEVAYPDVDIVGTMREAHVWELVNVSRRKVNRAAFLQKWFAREQAKSGKKFGSCLFCGGELVGRIHNGLHLECERKMEAKKRVQANQRGQSDWISLGSAM